MKIDSYSIDMKSRHGHVEEYFFQESLNISGQIPANPRGSNLLAGGLQSRDNLDLSERAQKLLSGEPFASVSQTASEPVELEIELSSEDERKIILLEKMIEKLTGKKIRFIVPEKIKLNNDGSAKLLLEGGNAVNLQRVRPQWGIRYDRVESYYESESLNFQAAGVVRTADGKEIHLSVELNMSREFAERNEIHFAAGNQAVDPLVISFGGNAPTLTSTKYYFDLDSDGDQDQISFVGAGSGFLALDLNNDGLVNNGKELFGPNSGNGFSELEAYDSDGNDWIDENDPIFERLRIWTKDAQGNDVLCALGEKGVGAIYLGCIATQYLMKDHTNQMHGKLAASGIYLTESGTAGTIHQIDLVV